MKKARVAYSSGFCTTVYDVTVIRKVNGTHSEIEFDNGSRVTWPTEMLLPEK